MHFSSKTTMDKLACSMVFRIICFMILYGDISSQPLYENSPEDRVTTKQREFYYQKVYGKPEKITIFYFFELPFFMQKLDPKHIT